ncbi:MAG: ATP-binding protein [Terrimicrobiaceae bacterium]|nr:ATP-binding protein [Terrimicrobiaceae bacterium]
MNTPPDTKPGIPGPGKWIAAFLAFVLVLAGVGAWFFATESSRIQQDKYEDLGAIAKLKTKWISDWRNRFFNGIGRISGNPFFAQSVAEFARNPDDPELRARLKDWLGYQIKWTGDEGMALYAPDGRLMLSAGTQEECPELLRVLGEAIWSNGAVLSRLYKGLSGNVFIIAACPVNDREGIPVAVLAIFGSANKDLYPLVEEWPSRSKTAETLLVERDGNSALFLNRLHFKPAAKMEFRIPLTETDAPAVQAVLGTGGKFLGRDYRGVEVIGDLRGVPGSPWFMVTKMDTAEAYAGLHEMMEILIFVSVSLSFAVAAAMAAIHRGSQVRFLRELDAERAASEENLRRANAELEGRVAKRTAQVVASNRELESFAYSVSHDLRAPLRAIEGFASILEEEYGPKFDGEGRRLLGIVRSSTRKMDHLIHGILDLSRIVRAEIVPSDVDMTALARAAWEEVQTPKEAGRFDFRLSPLPPTRGDALLLRQVWTNLLSNAVKYTAPREVRCIEVGAIREKENLTCYFVKDTGVGFDPTYASKLFGLFQRLHKDTDFEGVGIGLANVQRIVQRHGGTVRAEGSPGAGAAFFFTLPKNPENHEQ